MEQNKSRCTYVALLTTNSKQRGYALLNIYSEKSRAQNHSFGKWKPLTYLSVCFRVMIISLPGQPPLLHSPVKVSGPRLEQSLPPGLGGGLVQYRLRERRPIPQVTEHSVQSPH